MKKIFIHLSLFLFLTLPVVVLSQGGGGGGPITPTPAPSTNFNLRIENPFRCNQGAGECTLLGLINAILNNIIMPIAAVGVTIWIVWAGFGFLTAQGNPAKIDTARKRLLWSLIGAGILLGAAGISQVLQRTVGELIRV